MADSPENQRRRLSPIQDPYWPLRRAQQLTGSVLYWLPVTAYPVRAQEKEWMLAFFASLSGQLKEKLKFRLETFINFDFIYPDLQDAVLRYSFDFNPIIGLLAQPSQPLFRPPSEADIQKVLESGDASSIRNATKNIGYWLAKNKGPKHLAVFLGFGAMIGTWLPETEETKPPDFRISKKVLANPAFQGLNIEKEVEFTYSLRDPFLAKSKEVFAAGLKDDPQYRGMPFAVPLFTSRDILTARGEERDLWLDLFGAYFAESRADNGVLLWGKPDIDPLVIDAVDAIYAQGLRYPTA